MIELAPNAQARLVGLVQWRAGLRISEALALEVRDLGIASDRPTLRVRHGKGSKARVVPVHPELAAGFNSALAYGGIGRGRIFEASRSTAWRWIQEAARNAVQAGRLAPGWKVGTHTLRHSYARHRSGSGNLNRGISGIAA